MASPLKGPIAKAAGKALKGLCFPVTYRRSTTATLKAGAAYPIGTSTINMTNVPASWGGVVPGDTFLITATAYTITNTVAPVSGVMSGVAFTPALTTALTSGAALTVTHYRTSTARGFDMLVNAFNMANTLIQANDWKFTILADGLTYPPAVNDQIQTRTGLWKTIISVSLDPAGAVYTVQAR